uniref:hypothetical protein n=1 Tax=uncultured Bilophila sp. TaxID=529385 RepID=UPI00280C2F45
LLMEKQKQQTDEKSRFYLETAPRLNNIDAVQNICGIIEESCITTSRYGKQIILVTNRIMNCIMLLTLQRENKDSIESYAFLLRSAPERQWVGV